ncbi:MAG: TraR/DksA family transcriptional regulator [Planctomycetota bacterium]
MTEDIDKVTESARPSPGTRNLALDGTRAAARPAGNVPQSPATGARPDVARIRKRLAEFRMELAEELDHCRGELRSEDGNTLDEDDASTREAQTVCAQTIRHLASRIRQVDIALDRLESGWYGVCVECASAIASARLQANPLAERCLPCQQVLELIQRRRRR